MASASSHIARSLVVLLTAGGDLDDVCQLATTHGIRAGHVESLAVPPEEDAAQRRLLAALQSRLNGT